MPEFGSESRDPRPTGAKSLPALSGLFAPVRDLESAVSIARHDLSILTMPRNHSLFQISAAGRGHMFVRDSAEDGSRSVKDGAEESRSSSRSCAESESAVSEPVASTNAGLHGKTTSLSLGEIGSYLGRIKATIQGFLVALNDFQRAAISKNAAVVYQKRRQFEVSRGELVQLVRELQENGCVSSTGCSDRPSNSGSCTSSRNNADTDENGAGTAEEEKRTAAGSRDKEPEAEIARLRAALAKNKGLIQGLCDKNTKKTEIINGCKRYITRCEGEIKRLERVCTDRMRLAKELVQKPDYTHMISAVEETVMQELDRRRRQLEGFNQNLVLLRQSLASQRRDYAEVVSKEIARLNAGLKTKEEQAKSQEVLLGAKSRELEEVVAQSAAETTRLRAELSQAQMRLQQELAKKEEAITKLREEFLQQRESSRRQEEELRHELCGEKAELERVREALKAKEEALLKIEKELASAKTGCSRAKEDRDHEISRQQQSLENARAEITRVRQQLFEAERKAARLCDISWADRQTVREARRRFDAGTERMGEQCAMFDERFARLYAGLRWKAEECIRQVGRARTLVLQRARAAAKSLERTETAEERARRMEVETERTRAKLELEKTRKTMSMERVRTMICAYTFRLPKALAAQVGKMETKVEQMKAVLELERQEIRARRTEHQAAVELARQEMQSERASLAAVAELSRKESAGQIARLEATVSALRVSLTDVRRALQDLEERCRFTMSPKREVKQLLVRIREAFVKMLEAKRGEILVGLRTPPDVSRRLESVVETMRSLKAGYSRLCTENEEVRQENLELTAEFETRVEEKDAEIESLHADLSRIHAGVSEAIKSLAIKSQLLISSMQNKFDQHATELTTMRARLARFVPLQHLIQADTARKDERIVALETRLHASDDAARQLREQLETGLVMETSMLSTNSLLSTPSPQRRELSSAGTRRRLQDRRRTIESRLAKFRETAQTKTLILASLLTSLATKVHRAEYQLKFLSRRLVSATSSVCIAAATQQEPKVERRRTATAEFSAGLAREMRTVLLRKTELELQRIECTVDLRMKGEQEIVLKAGSRTRQAMDKLREWKTTIEKRMGRIREGFKIVVGFVQFGYDEHIMCYG